MQAFSIERLVVWTITLGLASISTLDGNSAFAQRPKKPAPVEVTYPPKLADGKTFITDTSEEFLKAPETLKAGVLVAKTPPTVDFLFYPGQDYPGKPWSNWGDSVTSGGKYYSAIGDHLAIGSKGDGEHGTGTAHVFEYDPKTKSLKELVDLAAFLKRPQGHYTPGKIHTQLGMGRDGWLYYATHRGSPKATTDEFHYKGDWIFRTHPETGKTEIVVHAPVPKHSVPTAVLDPDRLIYYGSTAAAFDLKDEGIQFFAYDIKNRKLLYSGPDGPARSMILARSTGRVYYVPGSAEGELMRFDPETGQPPQKVAGSHIGIRAATDETQRVWSMPCLSASVPRMRRSGRSTPRPRKSKKWGASRSVHKLMWPPSMPTPADATSTTSPEHTAAAKRTARRSFSSTSKPARKKSSPSWTRSTPRNTASP